MKNSFVAFAASFLFMQCNAQSGNQGIKEVEDALNKGASISSVLTNKTWLAMHPDRQFRKLIRDHADTLSVDISPEGEPGTRIRATVTLVDNQSKPVGNALVYFYQTDAKGWYAANSPHVGGSEGDMGQARLFGYARTNSSGQITILTVKPSGYPQSDLPAHIHIHFDKPGGGSHVTELLFDDDPRLVGNIREQSIRYGLHIAKPGPGADGADQQFSYMIRL